MELNVENYVRTKYGHIGKIIDINLGDFQTRYELDNNDEFHYEYKDDIIKSSPNIIDILEEHDFVQMVDRGHRFYEIEKDYTGKLSLRDIGWDEYEELDETNIPEIVSIVTHEQMEQMKYKIN